MWTKGRDENIVSINELRKYATFYSPYHQIAPTIPELRPLVDYLNKNGFRTNLDN